MTKLGQIVEKIRSKNAGPFWLTIDIFCGSDSSFDQVCAGVSAYNIGQVFNVESNSIKRFEIPSLNVVKISLPRPEIQGSARDRDMHGASWAVLLQDIEVTGKI